MSYSPLTKRMFQRSLVVRRDLRSRGFSLLLVLACVAVLSAILVAFLVAQRDERASSSSYSQSIKADELAMGGVDLVLQNLRQEIEDTNRSTVVANVDGPNVYLPKTNFFVIPERMASGAVASASTNLLKISSSVVAFYTNGPVLAAASSTAASSANGRALDKSRWNRPQLIDAGALNDFVHPDWILITRSGRTNAWGTALRDRQSDRAAIGRIAFAIYDIGGLFDVAAGGYPDALSGLVNVRQKGLLAYADMAQIPFVANADAFIKWRNAYAASTPAEYTNYAYGFGATNGFLKINTGDRGFVSRQDLIQYAKANPSVVGTNALPYLTTFTREFNAPSDSPPTPTASSIDYTILAQNSGATNVNFACIRDSTGQLLMKKRFPLPRINLLTDAAINSAEIEKYFGLKRAADNYSYEYIEAPIKTLSAVAAAGREPNFFELLQAAILRGSLGLSSNPGSQPLFLGAYFDASIMRQVLAIGANIIDQYDADSMPTIIHIPGDTTSTPIAGVENIPSINEMFVTVYRPTEAEGGSVSREKLVARMSFEVWNPHQNASSIPANGPSSFRIVARDGALRLLAYDPPFFVAPSVTSSPAIDFGAAYSEGTVYQIQFQNQAAFSEPTVLTTANSQNPDPRGVINNSSGIFLGSGNVPDKRLPESTGQHEYSVLQFQGEGINSLGQYCLTIEAQFRDLSGNWQTYQKFSNGLCNTPSNTPSVAGSPWTTLDLAHPQLALSRVDPRGSRWTASRINTGSMPFLDVGTPGTTVRPGASTGLFAGENGLGGPNAAAPFAFWPAGTRGWGDGSYIGMISDNDPSSEASAASTRVAGYKDLDNVPRHADGNTAQGVLPMAAGRTSDRPLILNRPFRSVAEMGYAFRDLPWKTLDFARGDSADAGLLDVFTAYDDVDVPKSVVAGKINLNTRRPEVLAAMLSGAGVREREDGENIPSASALDLAKDLVEVTTSAPLANKADLVRVFAAKKGTLFNENYLARKTEREATMRALADVGQTRTWNLLIDVVAQAGKYAPSAAGPDQFHVEGERRYWMQIAIDRYTGEIVDSQLEPVYE